MATSGSASHTPHRDLHKVKSPPKNPTPCFRCAKKKVKCDMSPPYSTKRCALCTRDQEECPPYVPYGDRCHPVSPTADRVLDPFSPSPPSRPHEMVPSSSQTVIDYPSPGGYSSGPGSDASFPRRDAYPVSDTRVASSELGRSRSINPVPNVGTQVLDQRVSSATFSDSQRRLPHNQEFGYSGASSTTHNMTPHQPYSPTPGPQVRPHVYTNNNYQVAGPPYAEDLTGNRISNPIFTAANPRSYPDRNDWSLQNEHRRFISEPSLEAASVQADVSQYQYGPSPSVSGASMPPHQQWPVARQTQDNTPHGGDHRHHPQQQYQYQYERHQYKQ